MVKSNYAKHRILIIFTFGWLSVLLTMLPVWSAMADQGDVYINPKPEKPINVTVDRIAKIKVSSAIARAASGNEEIASVKFFPEQVKNSPIHWVFVRAKKVGTTQLTIWGKHDRIIGTYDITVSPDVAGLKKSLYEIFPQENVSVRSSGGFITLDGTVSDSVKLTKILTLAQAFAPVDDKEAPKIVNLLQVGGVQQVMLEVRIAEISKSLGHELGVNVAWDTKNSFGLSLLDNLTSIPDEGFPGNGIEISDSINAVVGFISGDTLIVSVDALQEEGLLQILAKPTLIAQSGQSASFLAGGEFPFPVASSFDRFSIEWKPFGIGLNFTPTVLGGDTISMVVAPEVSDLDFTNTVSYAGYTVPSIETRRMSTVVELKDNQSFAIAGLLKNYVRESIKKFPLLGDIPILGALFRSTQYMKDETELVVIVTPHLVKPVDADEIPLPTDSFVEPSPFELLMLGMLEKRDTQNGGGEYFPETVGHMPMPGGDFGYIMPE